VAQAKKALRHIKTLCLWAILPLMAYGTSFFTYITREKRCKKGENIEVHV